MGTLTVKIPEALQRELERASLQAHLSKSELTRRALVSFIARGDREQPVSSALDLAGDLVGCFQGGPSDLASNPDHMKDFGQV